VPLHGAQRRPCNETPTAEREVRPRLGSGDATVLWDLHQVARSRVRAVAVAPGAVGAVREPPLFGERMRRLTNGRAPSVCTQLAAPRTARGHSDPVALCSN
jgi:hypothetical protein